MTKLLPYLFLLTSFFVFGQTETQTHIPDDAFEQALIDLGYDDVLDDYVLTQNINTVTELILNNKGITNFSGIEGFEQLEVLETQNNTDITLDLSSNIHLKELTASRVIAIDISSNLELEHLNIWGYSRTSEDLGFLDLTAHVNLKKISIGGTNISYLDLSNNILLEELSLRSNGLSEINLSQNTKLINLHLNKNGISTISLATNTLLKIVSIEEEPIFSIDLVENLPLERLTIRGTNLSEIDLSTYSLLTNINLSSNKLEHILLEKGSNQNITRLDISGNLKLRCLEVDDPDAIPTNWNKGLFTNYALDCSESLEINPDASVIGFQALDLGGLIPNDFIALDIEDEGYYDRVGDYFGGFFQWRFQNSSNILAITQDGNPGSMSFEIQGPISQTRVDNEAPFTLFETDYNPRFPEGKYTVTATPYGENNLQGNAGEALSISFTVVNESVFVYPQGKVIDETGQTWDISGQIEMVQEIVPIIPSNKKLNFESPYEGKLIDYIDFILTGPSTNIQTRDESAPYSLFKENDDSFAGMIFEPGEYTLQLIPKSTDSFRKIFYSPTWKFVVSASENRTYIPDDNFEQALIDLGYDDVLDDYVLTSNIDHITSLDLSAKNIDYLTGLESFLALEFLNISDNNLSWLRLENLVNLKTLIANSNSLSSPLDISKNVNLEILELNNNNRLWWRDDYSNLPNLKKFSALNTSLRDIDLSASVMLEELHISSQDLNKIDVTKNTVLHSLTILNSKIQYLDLSNNPELRNFTSNLNTDLWCIKVIDPQSAAQEIGFSVDATTQFASDCSDISLVGRIVGLQEVTNDNGSLYYHDINEGVFRRNDPEKQDLAETPFLAKSNYIVHTEGNTVESVRFGITNNAHSIDYFPAPTYIIDNEPPYMLSEDENGNPLFSIEDEGAITITATPFSEDNAEGQEGIPIEAKFRLYDKFWEFTDTLLIRDTADNSKVLEIIAGQENVFDIEDVRNKKLFFEVFEKEGFKQFFTYNIENESANFNGTSFTPYDTPSTFLESGIDLTPGTYIVKTSHVSIDHYVIPSIAQEWTFTITESEDSDGDGVIDDIDICPDTPLGQVVNASGCSLSQLADLAIQNISIGMGSDPCSDTPSCYINVGVLQDVEINVTLVKNGSESIYDGPVSLINPLFLENLTDGDYEICASNPAIPGFEQCYQVSSSATENSVNGTIVMQNADQEYTITASGSTSYTVQVNENSYSYNFNATDAQEITFPLVAGINNISLTGVLDCNSSLTYVPDDNFEQALIDLGYDDVLDDYANSETLGTITSLELKDLGITDFTGIQAMTELLFLSISGDQIESIDLSKNTKLVDVNIADTNLKILDLSNQPSLRYLIAFRNDLSNLILGDGVQMDRLLVQDNQIEVLDFTNRDILTLDVSNNSLISLILGNVGVTMNAVGNPNLICIQVSNVEEAITQPDWSKDDTASYSVDCSQGIDPDGLVDDNSIGDKMLAFPTLTDGRISIANPEEEEIAIVTVAAINGKRIALKAIHDNPKEINLDITGHSKGMYIIRVAKKSGKHSFLKVILK